MYNEAYTVIRVVLIANQSICPPMHIDVMCNTNGYEDQTSNGYHDFSLLDKNMTTSTCCLDILSKEINVSTEVINTNFLASRSLRKIKKIHQIQTLIGLYTNHSKEAPCP